MKTKILLQLFLTLLLGFVIGFMTNGYVTSQKIKNYSWGRGESMFWKHAMDELEVSQEQREKIIPIVKKYSEKGHRLMQENFEKIEPVWNDMNKEILPLLSKEQQLKLDEIKSKRSKKLRDRMRKSGKNGSSSKDRHSHDKDKSRDDRPAKER